MIEQQIRPWDVLDVDVLHVIEKTPRELFVPDRYQNLAFSDLEIPLQRGQFMLTPKIEARMLQALQVIPSDEVLVVGTGSGFTSACLAKLGKHVDTVEYYADLSARAQSILERLAINNVNCIRDDALSKQDYSTQYDVIAVTASMPAYPAIFEKLLADNGRMFVIVGTAPVMQAQLITRINAQSLCYTRLFETNVRPLTGVKELQDFQL